MDTPGLNDNELKLNAWIKQYEQEMSRTDSVSLVCLVILAKDRPDVGDVKNAAVLDECFKRIGPSNFVVIFNKAPSHKWNAEKA